MNLRLHIPAPLLANDILALLSNPESPLAKDLAATRMILAQLSATEKNEFLQQTIKQTNARRAEERNYYNFAMRKDAREQAKNAAEWQRILTSKPTLSKDSSTPYQFQLKALLLQLANLATLENDCAMLKAQRAQLQTAWQQMRQAHANHLMAAIQNNAFVLPNGQVVQFNLADPAMAALVAEMNERLAARRNVEDILENIPHVRAQYDARMQAIRAERAANRPRPRPGAAIIEEENDDVFIDRQVRDELNLNETRARMLDEIELTAFLHQNLKNLLGPNYKEMFANHPRGVFGAINDYLKLIHKDVDQKETQQMINNYHIQNDAKMAAHLTPSRLADELRINAVKSQLKLNALTAQRETLEDTLNNLFILKTQNEGDEGLLLDFLANTFASDNWQNFRPISVTTP